MVEKDFFLVIPNVIDQCIMHASKLCRLSNPFDPMSFLKYVMIIAKNSSLLERCCFRSSSCKARHKDILIISRFVFHHVNPTQECRRLDLMIRSPEEKHGYKVKKIAKSLFRSNASGHAIAHMLKCELCFF